MAEVLDIDANPIAHNSNTSSVNTNPDTQSSGSSSSSSSSSSSEPSKQNQLPKSNESTKDGSLPTPMSDSGSSKPDFIPVVSGTATVKIDENAVGCHDVIDDQHRTKKMDQKSSCCCYLF